ncbi:MAG TPA: ATP-binding protein [Lacunisphaera sp.]
MPPLPSPSPAGPLLVGTPHPSAPEEALPRARRLTYWVAREPSLERELAEALLLITAVTVAGWYSPLSYHALGHVYLLTVIVLSLRVGRWPALVAAVVSALAWDYAFIPPKLSFSTLDFDDALLLGTYFVVALTAGQLTTRIREQQRSEHQREQRATALFHLTRALAGTHTLDEGVAAALAQADVLFEAKTALLLVDEFGQLHAHPAGTLSLSEPALGLAGWAWRNRHEAGRFTSVSPEADGIHLPLLRDQQALGVLVIRPPAHATRSTPQQRDLLEALAAQIALLVEREQFRTASERTKLLAESDRLHRTLLDSVSHELRTPLAVLQSAAESLAQADGERRPELPQEILTGVRRLNRVVANLLSQSRLEAGRIRPRLDWCDARDLIAAARRELGTSLDGRPLRLEIPDDLPLIFADAPLMEHVITNLLLNAVLYSPAGTALTVSARLDLAKDRVCLSVIDEGPGISPELRSQLFQKFHRGEVSPGNGLGLGLAIVQGLMQAQGGDVAIEDHDGPGARFTIHLPHSPHTQVPHE